MLNIQHLNQDSFIRLLNYILEESGIHKIYISAKTPAQPGIISIAPDPRFDIPLSGKKHMQFASDGKLQDVYMEPGELHYSPPLTWKRPLWDTAHEMSSIVFYRDYIRITYINTTPNNTYYDSHGAIIYYHTSKPLGETGLAALKAFHLAIEHGHSNCFIPLAETILRLTLKNLKNDKPQDHGKATQTWLQICHYLEDNFFSPINRAHVASIFKLNPSYISRLFKQEGNEGFTHMLRRLRMGHAALLLKNTEMTIKEITDRCGYLSSTFFIAAFKKHYGIPPGKYRELKSINKNIDQ